MGSCFYTAMRKLEFKNQVVTKAIQSAECKDMKPSLRVVKFLSFLLEKIKNIDHKHNHM